MNRQQGRPAHPPPTSGNWQPPMGVALAAYARDHHVRSIITNSLVIDLGSGQACGCAGVTEGTSISYDSDKS
jgi:hypothetical protein